MSPKSRLAVYVTILVAIGMTPLLTHDFWVLFPCFIVAMGVTPFDGKGWSGTAQMMFFLGAWGMWMALNVAVRFESTPLESKLIDPDLTAVIYSKTSIWSLMALNVLGNGIVWFRIRRDQNSATKHNDISTSSQGTS